MTEESSKKNRKKSSKMDKHYESLSKLYLRLKGFLVSNLIIHSEHDGNLSAEIDIVGIKMPYHSQEYRWIDIDDYLDCSNSRIEILIAEVKNRNLTNVKFNKGLRTNRDSIKQLIDWLGIYPEVLESHIDKFNTCLNIHNNKNLNGFAQFKEDTDFGKFLFKFTFFCPSLPPWDGQGMKYIHGQEMIDFIWECLNETKKIKTCSRRYDFNSWNELEGYVRFFKEKDEKVTLESFEEHYKTTS